MDVRELTVFVAVAEELHFGRAAQRLSVAQPAVSQQVKRLERRLGVDLLARTSRSVTLTEAGRRLLDRARIVLADLDRLEAEVGDRRDGRAGRVGLGFVGTASYDLLPRVSRLVRAELPAVHLDLYGEQLTPRLLELTREGGIDLAVVRNAEPVDGLTLTRLREERLVAVVPAEEASSSSIALASLRERPFVVHPSGARSAMFEATLAACRSVGFTPSELIEVRETSTLVISVAAGLGVALVPEPVRTLRLDGVVYLDLSDVTPTTELALAHREPLGPAATRVAALIRRAVT